MELTAYVSVTTPRLQEKIWNHGITVKGDLIPFDINPGFPPLSRVGNSTFPFLEGHFGNLYDGNLFANDSGGTTRRVLLEGDTVSRSVNWGDITCDQTIVNLSGFNLDVDYTGPAGPAGPQGPAGADSTVPGPAGATGPAGPQDPKEQTRLYQDRQVRRDPQDPRDHRERQGRKVQLAHRVPQEPTLLYLARKDLKALQARLDRRDPQERTRLWPARKDPQALLALLDPQEQTRLYQGRKMYPTESTNYDIVALDSVTPTSNLGYNLGQDQLRWLFLYAGTGRFSPTSSKSEPSPTAYGWPTTPPRTS
eukprot:jgi/Tetstr1/462713/TSEL_007677.t1